MKLIDVILPLPLEGCFTYSVPEPLQPGAEAGKRVLVPLGRSKKYVGMILKEHEGEVDFELRDIIGILDERPTASPLQLRLWSWMAQYYMSPLGDVYRAAMPTGLTALDAYRPQTERCVALPERWRDKASLREALNMLDSGRAAKQKKMFECFLRLSGWDKLVSEGGENSAKTVAADQLLSESQGSAAVLQALVKRGLLQRQLREVGRLNGGDLPCPERIKTLSAAQQTAYEEINESFGRKNVVLLHGVTSSGKTEIYIHLIEKTIAEGRQVLYLLPEIALTVQMMQRLKAVFGNRLGIYHSKYSDAERVEIWRKQLSDSPYDVVLGARSAMFLPFGRLGLIIIDEEHETSFKQQEPAPRYHARSSAIMLANLCGAKTLLGTATPSMETMYNVATSKYGKVSLTTRFKDMEMPEIRVIDIKDLRHRRMMQGPFSPDLVEAMRSALGDGKQIILFQNRRGFAPMVECCDCGWVPKCRDCDVSLTVHKHSNMLQCHYCGRVYAIPSVCPNCGGARLHTVGCGTEKVEEAVGRLFPEAKAVRMDLDTTRSRNSYDNIIADFASGRTDILIGTQMVSKGLDFDNVAVVGILQADSMLNYPDFRANEQAFTMMTQVAGRAGRKGKRGLVIVQTMQPEMPLLRQVVANDFTQMCHDTLEERNLFHYPPFTSLIYVFIRHREVSVVESAATLFAQRLRLLLPGRALGPDSPSVAKVRTKNIRKIVIKLERGMNLSQVKKAIRAQQRAVMAEKRFAAVEIYYDVDPV